MRPEGGRRWGPGAGAPGPRCSWQWCFPATRLAVLDATGRRGRHHLHESAIQRAVHQAVVRSGLSKRATWRLVEGCTDTPGDYRGGPKAPWRERKLHYLEHLRDALPDELRVSLADKVDNARAIAADYRLLGEALWSRFSVGSRDQLWYYRSLVEVIRTARPPGRLLALLDAQVTEIEALLATAR